MHTETTSSNLPEFSVSQISALLKRTVEDAYPYVRIKGEISGFKRAPSGHLYLSVKDEGAVLAAVCWKGTSSKFAFKPEDGMEVVCTGRITTYPGQSKYQMIIDNMEIAGAGALMELLEKRKKMLAAEGLFDEANKKPIPFMPKTIGVVTSPTGAVIRDILHRIEERFGVRVLVWPVLVQGDKAAEQIANAINSFNKLSPDGKIPRPDTLIVARGGGSLEDLWPFNEEIVVRAAAASNIPIISAVGHETDTTLIDYAADLRAPTPTAAAEKAVPVKEEISLWIDDLSRRLKTAIFRNIDSKSEYLKGLARGIPKPSQILDEKIQRFDNLNLRLANIFPKIIKEKEQQLAFLAKLMESYHYKRVLERGFVLVRNNKNIVTSAASLSDGVALELEFHDGVKKAITEGKKPVKKSRRVNTEQESLF